MLVLSRRNGEEILIDGDIRIIIKEIRSGQVRIGIQAPKSVRILRGELVRPEVKEESENES